MDEALGEGETEGIGVDLFGWVNGIVVSVIVMAGVVSSTVAVNGTFPFGVRHDAKSTTNPNNQTKVCFIVAVLENWNARLGL